MRLKSKLICHDHKISEADVINSFTVVIYRHSNTNHCGKCNAVSEATVSVDILYRELLLKGRAQYS